MRAQVERNLIESLLSESLSRRGFVTRAMAAGLSAATVSALLAGRTDVIAQDPTPTPYAPETHGSDTASVRIRYWTILGGPDGVIMNELVRQFAEENPDIAVESLQGLTDFIPKLQAAAISDTAPDVALIRQTYIAPFAARNVLSPLESAELEQSGIKAEDYDPTVWEFTKFRDQQYTIPIDIHCFALLHNLKLLEGVGLGVPTTLDEWQAVNTVATKDDQFGYTTWLLGGGAPDIFSWYWFNFHRQFGGQFLNEDNTKAAFNTQEGYDALNWIKSMQDIGNPENVPTYDLQRTGKVATWLDGPWISTVFFDPNAAPAAPDLNAAPVPQRDPAAPAVWAQSHQFTLPRQNNPDEARRAASLKFIDWMTQHSVDWAKAGQVPARNTAREEALTSTDPYLSKLGGWASQLGYANYMPTVPGLLEVLARVGAAAEGAIRGEWSPEEGLSQAEEEVNTILEDNA
jgi:multiple sugar transport system substrate-binding protein